MRLEINYREKNVKNTNTWRINSTLLNNQEITEEIKQEIKKEALNDTIDQINLTFLGHSIKKEQITLSSQVRMEHSS